MSWHLSNALLTAYVNLPSLPALVEASSGDPSLAGGPSAPWSWTPFAPDDSASDRMMGTCHRSPCGMMFVPSTDAPGMAVLTSFRAAFPARTLVPRGRGAVSLEPDLASGGSSLASFARYDPVTCSWKTAQCLLGGGLMLYSEIWPRWGTMRAGACWARSTPGRPIAASGSGSLEATYPTPCAMDTAGQKHCNGGGNVKKWGGINSLGGMAAVGLWPTITVCGNNNRAGLSPTSGDGLATAVRGDVNKHFQMFPTLTRADGGGGPGNSGREGGNNLRTEVQQLEAKRIFPTPRSERAGRTIRLYPGNVASSAHARQANGGHGDLEEEIAREYPQSVGGALNPAWVEWLMGWVPGWTAPGPLAAPALAAWREAHATGTQWAADPAEAAGVAQVPRVIAKCDKRPARIRALGNGQVPACVVLAWQTLLFERP